MYTIKYYKINKRLRDHHSSSSVRFAVVALLLMVIGGLVANLSLTTIIWSYILLLCRCCSRTAFRIWCRQHFGKICINDYHHRVCVCDDNFSFEISILISRSLWILTIYGCIFCGSLDCVPAMCLYLCEFSIVNSG